MRDTGYGRIVLLSDSIHRNARNRKTENSEFLRLWQFDPETGAFARL